MVCPMPMPHEPCRARPRRRSRTWFAARCHGVASSASPSTVSRWNGLPRAARLGGQRERIDHHEAGQVGGHAVQRARAELGEGVVPPVGGDHVVRGLRSPVEAQRPPAPGRRAERVHHRALARVAVAEVDHGDVSSVHSRSFPLGVAAPPSVRSAERTTAPRAAPQRGEGLADRGAGRRSDLDQVGQARVEVDGLLAEADGERDRLADRVEVVELDHVLAEQVPPAAEDLCVAAPAGRGRHDVVDVEAAPQLGDAWPRSGSARAARRR